MKTKRWFVVRSMSGRNTVIATDPTEPINAAIAFTVVRTNQLHLSTAQQMEDAEANARLIAAAPDLLAALEEMAACEEFVAVRDDPPACFFCLSEVKTRGLDHYIDHRDNCALMRARAAIAKARGE